MTWDKDRGPRCFACQKFGHLATHCPDAKTVPKTKVHEGKLGRMAGYRCLKDPSMARKRRDYWEIRDAPWRICGAVHHISVQVGRKLRIWWHDLGNDPWQNSRATKRTYTWKRCVQEIPPRGVRSVKPLERKKAQRQQGTPTQVCMRCSKGSHHWGKCPAQEAICWKCKRKDSARKSDGRELPGYSSIRTGKLLADYHQTVWSCYLIQGQHRSRHHRNFRRNVSEAGKSTVTNTCRNLLACSKDSRISGRTTWCQTILLVHTPCHNLDERLQRVKPLCYPAAILSHSGPVFLKWEWVYEGICVSWWLWGLVAPGLGRLKPDTTGSSHSGRPASDFYFSPQ